MTQEIWSSDKLIELWLTAQEEPISESDRAELNRQIAENPHLRERLILLSQEQSWLMWHGADTGLGDALVQPVSVAVKAWNQPSDAMGRSSWLPAATFWPIAGVFLLGILTIFAVSRWSEQKPQLPIAGTHDTIMPGSVLKITSGSATLALPGVGYVALEGPTELEMLTPMRAQLKHGRIRVRVTEKTGYGFVVEYPNGTVTDLGTEFGLNVPLAGAEDDRTSVVVFEGAVNLERSAEASHAAKSFPVQRLIRGEGVKIAASGALDRVMSVVTGNGATFDSASDSQARKPNVVIEDVTDNLHSTDTKKFYEIVPGGFGEDALAFVDRPGHEWNGVTQEGLPKYLIGADYVKTFADDSRSTSLEISVRFGRPANLYVLVDEKLPVADWLKRSFHKTKDKVGVDLGAWSGMARPLERQVGPGNSVDHQFDVWVRTVKKPGVVTLGANPVRKNPYMYGIVAVPLEANNTK